MNRVYCFAEDRVAEETGLRFALISLQLACPNSKCVVYRPNPSPDFAQWVQAKCPNAAIRSDYPAGAYSWNCKPHVLLPLLEEGYDEVIWLDSDIIVSRDPTYLFDSTLPEDLVGTEEPVSSVNQGSEIRASGWGLQAGRSYSKTLNTSVLRVTSLHVPLLIRWKQLLEDPAYLAAQRQPLSARPTHLMSDQDVLNALLGSKDFEHLSVRFLRGGIDVIHCGGALGYSLVQRLQGLRRPIPPFLHAIASKPWVVFTAEYKARHSGWFNFYRGVLQETSPYLAEARKHRADVSLPCPWLDSGTLLGRLLRVAGFGHFALRGLPLTIAATLGTNAKRLLRGD